MMKRRKPVSYAEDSDSDYSDTEYTDRRRDIDNNKVRNGRNRESHTGDIIPAYSTDLQFCFQVQQLEIMKMK